MNINLTELRISGPRGANLLQEAAVLERLVRYATWPVGQPNSRHLHQQQRHRPVPRPVQEQLLVRSALGLKNTQLSLRKVYHYNKLL